MAIEKPSSKTSIKNTDLDLFGTDGSKYTSTNNQKTSWTSWLPLPRKKQNEQYLSVIKISDPIKIRSTKNIYLTKRPIENNHIHKEQLCSILIELCHMEENKINNEIYEKTLIEYDKLINRNNTRHCLDWQNEIYKENKKIFHQK